VQEDILQSANSPKGAKRYTFSEVNSKLTALASSFPSLLPPLSRALGTVTAPVYDFLLRGVDGMSHIWAVPLRIVWARESPSKPYYPGIVIKDDNKTSKLAKAMGEVNFSRIPGTLQRQLSR
jgi:hypothetical protein